MSGKTAETTGVMSGRTAETTGETNVNSVKTTDRVTDKTKMVLYWPRSVAEPGHSANPSPKTQVIQVVTKTPAATGASFGTPSVT
jgi:hypothetical protein